MIREYDVNGAWSRLFDHLWNSEKFSLLSRDSEYVDGEQITTHKFTNGSHVISMIREKNENGSIWYSKTEIAT